MKKIMILGAGIYQVPLIKTAKELGLYVIVVSIPGNYPGFELADKVYYANTTDYESVLKIAVQEKIDAITCTGTDVAVISAGYVSEKMGLPGLSYDAAQKATNKFLMKKAFCRGGVSSSEFAKISTETEAIQAAAEIGYPVMLKIVDKSGSRGITKTYNDDQLLEAYRYAKSCSELPYFLIEKYISGREIGVDAFIQNGKVKLIIPHEKLVYHSMRTGIPIGHICPMVTSSALKAKIEKEMRASIGALGLDNCAVNMDAFITDDGDVSVIEVAGRCGATGIPEVISGYLGVNYYEIILKLALGEEIELPEKFNTRPTLSFLLFAEKTGIIDCIEYEADEQKLQLTDYENPGKIKVHLDYIPGEVVEQFTNGTKRIGLVVLSDENRDALLQKYEQFEKSFHIRLK